MRFFHIRGIERDSWLIYENMPDRTACIHVFGQTAEATIREYVDALNARADEIGKEDSGERTQKTIRHAKT